MWQKECNEKELVTKFKYFKKVKKKQQQNDSVWWWFGSKVENFSVLILRFVRMIGILKMSCVFEFEAASQILRA